MRKDLLPLASRCGRFGFAVRPDGLGHVVRSGIIALCVVVGLAAALAGCGSGASGSNTSSGGGSGGGLGGNSGGGSGSPQPTLQDNTPNGQDSTDGLMLTGSFTCEDNAVLATDQLTYSDSDIQNLLSYWSTQNPTGPLPSILKSVPGTPDPCTADVTVTNTSNQTITIIGGGVHNVSAPVTNTFEYRTIDFCNMQNQGLIPTTITIYWCGRGGAPTCTYDLQVPLSSGDVGTDYTKAFAVDGCKTISLPPAQAADITMELQSDQPLIYLVDPELTVADNSGTHNVVFSNWSNTLAYASQSQMPCYQLSQDTFSLESGTTFCS